MSCPFCEQEGTRLWSDDRLRVVSAADPRYPGFCRVVWFTHVKEMSDLTPADRHHFMAVVFGVEGVLRTLLRPDKINLASLGNQVPHLHWHVIPRWVDDSHFPEPVWCLPQRVARTRPALKQQLARLPAAFAEALPRQLN
ncbi:MAG: HIT family protein [Burkholderiales bacterium]|nr:HIT family protein [Burkholderiales bacterium]